MKTEPHSHTCDGWVRIQHPMKPLGVIMQEVPCQTCNADGKIPPVTSLFEVTYKPVPGTRKNRRRSRTVRHAR